MRWAGSATWQKSDRGPTVTWTRRWRVSGSLWKKTALRDRPASYKNKTKEALCSRLHRLKWVLKYTFSPAELSSERGEKEVLADSKQPTVPPSTKSHVSYCAAGARRREKMAAEGTSTTTGRSLLQSVLVSAVDSCPCPHPSHPSSALLPIAPLSLSPTRFDAFKDVIVSIVHNMLPILGEQPRHPGYRPVYMGFPYDL